MKKEQKQTAEPRGVLTHATNAAKWVFYNHTQWGRELKQHAEQAEAERKRIAKAVQETIELGQLRNKIATSTTNHIRSRKTIRQLLMIVTDNASSQEEAELNFLRRVSSAGGNAAVNVKVFRSHGGFVTWRGDAVIVESPQNRTA